MRQGSARFKLSPVYHEIRSSTESLMRPMELFRATTLGFSPFWGSLRPPRRRRRKRPSKLDKVSFGTNWVAEAEHGGFFQAVADGTYKKLRPRRHHRSRRSQQEQPHAA